MRKLLALGGILLALLVAAHYARWQWANPGSHVRHDSSTPSSVHRTCGQVASVYHDTHDSGQPTFVDMGHDYPNQAFTVLIWQRDLRRFTPAPETWQGKHLCVTGKIRIYKGRPEIIAYSPDQVRVR